MFDEFKFGIVVGLILGFFLAWVFFATSEAESYRNGQIDAVTGKMRYELVVMPDSTKQWVVKTERKGRG